MRIIVCGAGQVGSTIAKQLAAEDNHVTVIDHSRELIRNINDHLDVNAVHGHASHPEVIERAGGRDADMLIAVTSTDETNMVSCQIAHTLFKIPVKIARLRHQSYLATEWQDLYRRDHMPIDVIISPEIEVAEAVIRRLNVPGATDMVPYGNGILKMVSLHCNAGSSVSNLPLHLLNQRIHGQLRMHIVGVVHKNNFHIASPDRVVHDHDEVFFLVHEDDLPRAMTLFGHEEKEARRVLIIGGGNIGLTIAKQLTASDPKLKIQMIEYDKQRASQIAGELENVTVLRGSGLSESILADANINLVETLIAVTNDDKVNVLSSLLAKRMGAKRAITLVNTAAYAPLTDSLGIDVSVNPRETTVSTILQHLRRGKIRGVHSVHDGVAEIIELEAIAGSPMIGKTPADFVLPKEVEVGAVIRGKKVYFPPTDITLQEHDRIVICALTKSIRKIEHLFISHESIF